jgi:hypothetical protein
MTTTSPIPLTLGEGTHTITVEYCYRKSPSSGYVIAGFDYGIFTVAKGPTIVVTSSVTSSYIFAGQNVTFTAHWNTNNHPKDIGWDTNISGVWTPDVDNGGSVTLTALPNTTSLGTRAWLYVNGQRISSEVVIPVH